MKAKITLITILFIIMIIPGFTLKAESQSKRTQGNRKFGLKEEANKTITKRVALVIGNSTYRESVLKNPINDAQDMAKALTEFGFDVDLKLNANKEEMYKAIQDFGAKLEPHSVALFYYAGHGIQSNGENYLVPVDADIKKETELPFTMIQAGFVLAQMEDVKDCLNLVILDACRNNPFERSFRSNIKGLAQMKAPTGTLIAYATSPGSVASDGEDRNGLYTQELLKAMKTPGLPIEKVFKEVRKSVIDLSHQEQVPWDASSLVGEFYFVGDGSTPVTINNNISPTSTDKETLYWESIKDSEDPEDYKNYLKSYPVGAFASIAKNKLKKFEAPAKPPQSNRETYDLTVERQTPTKIKVNVGDQINISATGRIVLGPVSGEAGPNGLGGVSGQFFKVYNVVPNQNHGAMLVRINSSGNEPWGLAGDSCSFSADRTGVLEFMVNDKEMDNDVGHFNVKVEVIRNKK